MKNEVSKTQNIRLIDVLLLGPLMIVAGVGKPNKFVKMSMIVGGIATIVYNWNNYIKQRDTQ